MRQSKISKEQIVYALRQAETGTCVGGHCRQLGVSDATFCARRKKYVHLGVHELQRIVADLSLDKRRLSADPV